MLQQQKTRRGVYYNKKGKKKFKMQMKRSEKYCKSTGTHHTVSKENNEKSVDEKRLQINLIVILSCGCS